jgi:alpha-tubulin suppressor-like RCC1 family protein
MTTTPPAGEFKQITCGFDFSCGIKMDDSLDCWGLNDEGQTDHP